MLTTLSLSDYKEVVKKFNGNRLPRQRVCKGCGSKWALLRVTKDGVTKAKWVPIDELLKYHGDTYADYNFVCKSCNPADDGLAARQSTSCVQCKGNRVAKSGWLSPTVVEVNMVTGAGAEHEGTDDTLKLLKTTIDTCCGSKCPTFEDLVKAHNAGVQKRGVVVDPCEGCVRYWNPDHSAGPCVGMFIDPGECKVTYVGGTKDEGDHTVHRDISLS